MILWVKQICPAVMGFHVPVGCMFYLLTFVSLQRMEKNLNEKETAVCRDELLWSMKVLSGRVHLGGAHQFFSLAEIMGTPELCHSRAFSQAVKSPSLLIRKVAGKQQLDIFNIRTTCFNSISP